MHAGNLIHICDRGAVNIVSRRLATDLLTQRFLAERASELSAVLVLKTTPCLEVD